MEVADTLKMRFPYQVWYCFSFSACLFWIMVFSLCKLHYYSSNRWIVVAQKTPEFIAFSWYWVSAFTLPFKLFFNLNNRGCLWELLFLASQHSFLRRLFDDIMTLFIKNMLGLDEIGKQHLHEEVNSLRF